jgi:hypothetical protein
VAFRKVCILLVMLFRETVWCLAFGGNYFGGNEAFLRSDQSSSRAWRVTLPSSRHGDGVLYVQQELDPMKISHQG